MSISIVKRSLLLVSVFSGLIACEYSPVEVVPTPDELNPDIDYSKMYVLGGTYSSGLMDGALYQTGQSYSYPNLVASRIEEVLDDSVFTQAVVDSEIGINFEPFLDGESKFTSLTFESNIDFYPARNTTTGVPLTNWTPGVTQLHNFSFPGLKLTDLNDPSTLSVDNPYVGRISGLTGNPVDAIIDQDPEIVILDLGKDELFNYAFYGASGNENPGIGSIADSDLLASIDFQTIYTNILNRFLNETDAQIFIFNIPETLNSPYFQTIHWAFELEIFDLGYISNLTFFYSNFNAQIAQHNFIENPDGPKRPRLNFDLDNFPNEVSRARVIRDETLFDAQLDDGTVINKWRQMTENELLGFNLEPSISYDNQLGGAIPLPDNLVLTETEIQIIQNRISDYNLLISGMSDLSERVHLVDIQTPINQVFEEEYFFGGVQLSAGFDQYSIYSADGYTFNPRGNALIANTLLEAINSATGSSLSTYDLNDFPGISFSLNTPETDQ